MGSSRPVSLLDKVGRGCGDVLDDALHSAGTVLLSSTNTNLLRILDF